MYGSLCGEFWVRLALLILFWISDYAEPFQREIHEAELILYQYPHVSGERINFFQLLALVAIIPCCVIGYFAVRPTGGRDAVEALLGYSLAVPLTGLITNIVKLAVGRPRPDFYRRCFPDGVAVFSSPPVAGILSFDCKGSHDIVMQGRKSFPSGHTSLAFASFGFCSLYLAGKLKVFHPERPSKAMGLVIALTPVMMAVMIGISRTCDYRHHWQDVIVGAVLGALTAYVGYRQYFPRLTALECEVSLRNRGMNGNLPRVISSPSFHSSASSVCKDDMVAVQVDKRA